MSIEHSINYYIRQLVGLSPVRRELAYWCANRFQWPSQFWGNKPVGWDGWSIDKKRAHPGFNALWLALNLVMSPYEQSWAWHVHELGCRSKQEHLDWFCDQEFTDKQQGVPS